MLDIWSLIPARKRHAIIFYDIYKRNVIEKYSNNQQISNYKNIIDIGFAKIIEKYKTNDNLDIKDLQNYYYEIFKLIDSQIFSK